MKNKKDFNYNYVNVLSQFSKSFDYLFASIDYKTRIEEMKILYNYFLNFIDDNERSEENFIKLTQI